MFKSYANKITSFLIENKEINKDDYEIYKYGFEVLIAFIVNTVVILSIGLLFNKIFYSIVFLICYCLIMFFLFYVLIVFIVNTVVILSIGLLFNKLFYSIVFLICYCPIRQFAGGYHANNYTKCLLIFILIFILTINTSSNVDSQIYTLMIF